MKVDIKELAKEALNELMYELEADVDTQPTKKDLALGGASAKLAQLKGELNTILDKAEQAGIISKNGGNIKILKKDAYIKYIGELPKQIKALQQKLMPPSIDDTENQY